MTLRLLLCIYCSLLPYQVNAVESENNVLTYEIAASATDVKYLKITAIARPYSIAISDTKTQISKRIGAESLVHSEYLILPKNKNLANYQIEVSRPNNKPINPEDIILVERNPNTEQAYFYNLLSRLSENEPTLSQQQVIFLALTEALEQTQSTQVYCDILEKLAVTYYLQGEYENIANLYEQQKNGQAQRCFVANIHYADSLFLVYNFAAAYTEYDKLYSALAKVPSDFQSSLIQSPLVKSHLALFTGFSLLLKGKTQGNQLDIAQSKQYLDFTKEYMNEENIKKWLPELQNAYATYYYVANDYSNSIDALEQAITYQQQLGSEGKIDSYLNNLSSLYIATGKLAKAQATIKRSLALENDNSNMGKATQTANLAKTYWLLGDNRTANRYFQQALSLLNQTEEGSTSIHINLAYIAISQKKYNKAYEELRLAEKDATLNWPEKLPLINALKALSHSKQNDIDSLNLLINKQSEYQEKTMKLEDKIAIHLIMAQAHLNVDNLDATELELNLANKFSIQELTQKVTYHHLNIKHLDKNNPALLDKTKVYQNINQHFETALNVIKQTVTTLDFKKVGAQWMSKSRDILDTYINISLSSMSIANKNRSFQAIEAYQGLMLRYNREYFLNTAPEDASELNKLPSYPLLDNQSVSRLQKKLAPNEAVLRYFSTPEQDFLFIMTSEHFWLFNPQLALNKQNPLLPFDYLVSSANDYLPIDLLTNIGIKKLVIVPDKALHHTAFSALNTTGLNSEYHPLHVLFDISITHSVNQYFEDLQLTKSNSPYDFTIFVDPAFDSATPHSKLGVQSDSDLKRLSFPALSWSKSEANSIKQYFPQAFYQLLSQERANVEALLHTDTRQSKLIHIATHAYYDQQQPELTGLITASDTPNENGFLPLTTLSEKSFYADLVVLSGCETNLGELLTSEGLNSLSRRLLAQGAGAVVSTLWKVPDKSTAIFMDYFYQGLANEKGHIAKALTHAKKRMRQSPRYRHPKYWAGFVLTLANKQYEIINLN